MELTFQLTASGLSERDLDMQGWRVQEEVEHHNRKWLDQHILQGTGASGRAGLFLGTTKGTHSIPPLSERAY